MHIWTTINAIPSMSFPFMEIPFVLYFDAEESIESAVTCMSCMSILNNPVTMTRCGHNVCLACVTATANDATYKSDDCTTGDADEMKRLETSSSCVRVIACPECGLEHCTRRDSEDSDKENEGEDGGGVSNVAYVENKALDIMSSKQAYRKGNLLSLQKLCSVSC